MPPGCAPVILFRQLGYVLIRLGVAFLFQQCITLDLVAAEPLVTYVGAPKAGLQQQQQQQQAQQQADSSKQAAALSGTAAPNIDKQRKPKVSLRLPLMRCDLVCSVPGDWVLHVALHRHSGSVSQTTPPAY